MRLTAGLGILAATNIVVLVATHWYVISGLGATRQTDALFAGMALPQVFLMIVSGSLSSVLVPLFVSVDRETARRDAWGLLVAVVGVFAAAVAILDLTARFWVPLLVPGFSASERALTVSLTQIQLTSLVLTAGVGVLSAFAQAAGRFVWTESAALFAGFGGLVAIVCFLGPFGVAAAAWVVVLRALVQFLCLVPLLGWWRRPDWRSPLLAEAWTRTSPVLLGATYYKLDPLVDRFLASMAPAGGLSLLSIGQQVFSAGSQVITRALVAPVVPRLADHASQGAWTDFQALYRRRLLLTGSAVSVASATLWLPGNFLADLLSSLGGLGPREAATLLSLLGALVGMFIGGCIGQLTSTAFYSMGDTRTPTRLGVYVFSAYVPAKCLSFVYYGLMGMASSISVYYLVAVVVQLVALERAVRGRLAELGIDAQAKLVSRLHIR